ncbi:hypothetical protein [Saccharothrix hoggarensis]|uniref:Uncharacterized protein n=1 Tax=Saccharothrix hoggarensis TaxID=913853 RepID=A0ABW3R0W5_9PSEU
MDEQNPWQTPAGERAQQVRLRVLAQGRGEVAEFAREVLAGRASIRDVVYSPVLSDAALEPVRSSVAAWDRMSNAERERLAAEAANHTEERIAALNALDVPAESTRRAPVVEDDDDPDDGRPLMSDAW